MWIGRISSSAAENGTTYVVFSLQHALWSYVLLLHTANVVGAAVKYTSRIPYLVRPCVQCTPVRCDATCESNMRNVSVVLLFDTRAGPFLGTRVCWMTWPPLTSKSTARFGLLQTVFVLVGRIATVYGGQCTGPAFESPFALFRRPAWHSFPFTLCVVEALQLLFVLCWFNGAKVRSWYGVVCGCCIIHRGAAPRSQP